MSGSVPAALEGPIAAGPGWLLTAALAGLALGLLVASFVSPLLSGTSERREAAERRFLGIPIQTA